MAWTDNELSTLASLAKHEAEINNLAQRYTRIALVVSAANKMTASPNTLTGITAIDSSGNTTELVYADGKWEIGIGTYVKFVCSAQNTYFSLLEGTNSTLYSASGTYTLTFQDKPTWADVELVSDWQPKIELAKDTIYNHLSSSLSTRISSYYISDVIDGIVNPEILALASDYKALELIFLDLLGKIGTMETIQSKIDYYRINYQQQFDSVITALDFGDYSYLFQSNTGRIVR